MTYERRGKVILVNIPSRPSPPVQEPDGGLASRLSFEDVRKGCKELGRDKKYQRMIKEAMDMPRPYD